MRLGCNGTPFAQFAYPDDMDGFVQQRLREMVKRLRDDSLTKESGGLGLSVFNDL